MNSARPFASVLMPIRNEAAFIERSLGAILAQDYPDDRMEILVIDGGSDDGTPDIVRRLATRSGKAVDVIVNPGRIVPTGLNLGLERARGDVIVRVDGHCEIASDYVTRCVDVLEETGADNVGGVQRAVGSSLVGRAIAIATTSSFGAGNARFRVSTKREWVDTVYLGAYRRDVFDRIGTFDETLSNNQDDEFNLRLVRAGGRILLDPDIRVLYRPRESLRSLWRQYFRYGEFKVPVIAKVRSFTALRHFVPSLLVIGIVGAAAVAFGIGRPVLALALPVFYSAADLGASVLAARRDPAVLVVLPAVYPTMHFAYGIGFVAGLWRFRARPHRR